MHVGGRMVGWFALGWLGMLWSGHTLRQAVARQPVVLQDNQPTSQSHHGRKYWNYTGDGSILVQTKCT